MDGLTYWLMAAGIILFILDFIMIQMFCSISFTFLDMLSPGGCNRKTRKVVTKIIYFCFLLRAFSANLMNTGPSILDLFLFNRTNCEYYHVYCYIDQYE